MQSKSVLESIATLEESQLSLHANMLTASRAATHLLGVLWPLTASSRQRQWFIFTSGSVGDVFSSGRTFGFIITYSSVSDSEGVI